MFSFKLFSIFFLISFYSYSQIEIKGIVKDSSNVAVEFANVVLANHHNEIIAGGITDEKGQFKVLVEKGIYKLTISFIGYKDWIKNISTTNNQDFGVIVLAQDSNKLDEVVVTAKKPLIERKVDRLVFNVENSVAASGGDGLDVLRVTPGVRVQNDAISMVGKNGMAVMVDDRLLQLSGEDLVNYLKNINTESIKSIEVISNPPAKYQAEGNSGLINIKLKQLKNNSWNSSISTFYRQNTYPLATIGGVFNYRKNKLITSANIRYSKGSSAPTDINTIFYPQQIWHEENQRMDFTDYLKTGLSFDYNISKKISTGIQYDGSYSNPSMEQNDRVTLSDVATNSLDSLLITKGLEKPKHRLHSLNYHFVYTIDTIVKKKLSFDFDYFNYNSNNDRTFTSNNYLPNGNLISNSFFSGNNVGKQDINNYSFNLDMQHEFKNFSLNYGGRVSLSRTNNDIAFYNLTSGVPVLDSQQTNTFEYNENIQSLYLSATKSFSKKWETQLGLRLENTQTTGNSLTLDHINKNDYNKLFPTVYVSYSPNDEYSYNINYGRRIRRPRFNWLNPFRSYLSQYAYVEGNPFLQPSFSNNLELNFVYKGNLNLQLYYNNINNGFGQWTFFDPNNQQVNFTKPVNYYNSDIYGTNLTYTFKKIAWWESINIFNINYSATHSTIPETNSNRKGTMAYLYFDNTFKLSKKVNFNINYWYGFAGASDLDKSSASSQLNTSLQIRLLDKKLTMTLAGYDLLSSNRPIYTSFTDDIRIDYKNYYDTRSFRFSLTYKFGNNNIGGKQREQKNKEELNRTN